MSSDALVGIAEKAARGGFFLFVGSALSTVILAIGAILIARFLGPANYGLYTLTLVMPTVFNSLADAGMNAALMRFPAKLRSEGNYLASNRAIRLGFQLKLSLSLIAFLICYFGAEAITTNLLNRPELTPYLQLAGAIIIFQAFLDAASNSFIGLDLMNYSASIQILYSVVKSVLAPALILLGFGIGGAITGCVLGACVAGIVGTTILFGKYARSRNTHVQAGISQHGVKLNDLLDYSLPLYVATIFTVLFAQYQNLVLARLATNTQIGNFNAAWSFNSLLTILVYPISIAIFPMFSKMNPENQRSDLARAYVLAVKYTSLILIPAAMAVMVLSQDLVLLTYGKGYLLAPQYLAVLAALYLLNGIGLNVIGSFLNGVGFTRTNLKMNALEFAVYLPLGPGLTWLWGPYGLLIAFITCNAVSTLYGVWKVSASFRASPDLGASARIFFASLIAAVPSAVFVELYVAGTGVIDLIIGGCLFLAAYLTLVPIVGAVRLQDIKNLETILCKPRAVALFARPVLAYETRVLSALGRD
jgi:O-antigen/teichoic acid export membrane protein